MKQQRKRKERKTEIIVPKEYAGQWVVWNQNGTAIVGHANSLQDALVMAERSQTKDPAFEYIPPTNRLLARDQTRETLLKRNRRPLTI